MNPLVLVEQCYKSLPLDVRERPWDLTDHGRKVLQTEDELNAYIAAYGEMHILKCRAALQNFPFEKIDNSYEIFDWGCGQGLATLTLLDMLQERNMLSRLQCIYLIEPSKYALQRAVRWVQYNAGPGVKVVGLDKYIPSDICADIPEISCSSGISINLFSNILDIRTLSLAWLAKKTSSLAPVNFMVCVGPKFTNNTNTRITDFCGYFNPSEYFSNINAFPYSYTSKTHHPFGCYTRCFVHARDCFINSNYQERAFNEEYYDPYDYTSESIQGIVDDNVLQFYNSLRSSCSSSYDIFFRPTINCDKVDIILISRSKGIILINVCEKKENIKVEFNRIKQIKNNIFNLHLKTIKVDSILLPSVYNCVKTALFFPNYSINEIDKEIELLNAEANENNNKQKKKDEYAFLYKFTRDSNLNEELEKIRANGFRDDYFVELSSLISAKWHSYKEGDLNFRLSARQKDIVRNNNKRIRVKGVAGCGKTQVVANRAVELHLKTGERVLVITYNVSLIQYIRMRINQVPADFSPDMFEVVNYHQFFNSKANMYKDGVKELSDYDDENFFEWCTTKKYRSIIIDEVQDFKPSWLRLITKYFLAEDGYISVFGDGEQNIYDRKMDAETKMPSLSGCGFTGGPWPTMSERISMRFSNPRIASLSSLFAREFMDNPNFLQVQETFNFEENYIKYWNIENEITAEKLVAGICRIIDNHNLDTKDVVVLAQSISLLRDLEAAYVLKTNKKTMINFETLAQYECVKDRTSVAYIHKNLDEIRRAAKTHFTTACQEIKMSTIHSFKGWESKTIILILQPIMKPDEIYEGYKIHERENTPALIYTALTRAKSNLFLINLNNHHYHSFFNENIN